MRRRSAAALLFAGVARAFLLPAPARAPSVARRRPTAAAESTGATAESTDEDDDDDDGLDGEAVIGLETLPEALQAQIIDAITRSRTGGGSGARVNGARAAAAAMGVDQPSGLNTRPPFPEDESRAPPRPRRG